MDKCLTPGSANKFKILKLLSVTNDKTPAALFTESLGYEMRANQMFNLLPLSNHSRLN